MENIVKVPIGNGAYFYAQAIINQEHGPEVVVGVCDENEHLQDIVITHLKKTADPNNKQKVAELLLYGNEYEEGHTATMDINIYPVEETEIDLENVFREGVSPEGALAMSIRDKGCPDMAYMEDITKLTEDEIMKTLEGKIFPVPGPSDDEGYVKYTTKGEYLSGTPAELEARLQKALDAAEMSEYFDRNVIALQKVLCGKSFTPDLTSIKHIIERGGKFDKYGIPHFDAEVFANLQHTDDSATETGKKTLMIPTELGISLIIEDKNFVIDNKKEKEEGKE